jgi:hypothetical protein
MAIYDDGEARMTAGKYGGVGDPVMDQRNLIGFLNNGGRFGTATYEQRGKNMILKQIQFPKLNETDEYLKLYDTNTTDSSLAAKILGYKTNAEYTSINLYRKNDSCLTSGQMVSENDWEYTLYDFSSKSGKTTPIACKIEVTAAASKCSIS